MRLVRSAALLVVLLTTIASTAHAQSIPTATITGKVSADGAPLPGVTVTVTSPNLQGTRTTVTSSAGDYIVPLLPPGDYSVTFELSGMQNVTRKARLTAARTDHIDVEFKPAAITESITVTADTPMTGAVDSTQVSTNFKQDMIEQLPILRNIENVALMAPGVAPTGPGENLVISGAMSYDSLYLVNGAVVSENLRGQPHDLFIEDAIQETTVLTGGISAEYGHFTGGVVSAITKSGGNSLSGSFRTNLSNESWNSRTPLTVDQEDKINTIYEATIGGPLMRDRLWFFGAGRSEESNDIRQTVPGLARLGDQDANGAAIPVGTPLTPYTYPHGNEERRLEGKLTGSITSKHTLVASYLDIDETETNQTGQTILDLDSLVAQRETPNTLLALNYNGSLTNRFFLEAQYSKKEFSFLGGGSTYYDNIKGTLIVVRGRANARYWSPTFRNTPEGEQRNNRLYTVKGTYFWSTPSFGSHDIKLGYEDFNEVRLVNNYGQGSDFRLSIADVIIRGNQIFPRLAGGASGTTTRIEWRPIFVLSQGSDYDTKSVYLNDRWALNQHWTFNLGVRYDKNDALSAAHTFKIADDSAISPRLAAHYDIFGNGRLIVNTSYGSYVGRLSEGAANDADPAGRTALLSWNYQGPSINNDVNAPTSQLVPTARAMQMIFDWFMANGGTSRRPFRSTPSVPGVESVLDPDGLRSPKVKEWTLGAGTAIGTRGYARADLVMRNWDNFYTSYRDTTTGKVTDAFNTRYDLSIIRSDSETYDREYTGVQTQFSYRLLQRLNLGGTYTWSRLVGNVTGEDSGSGPLVGVAGEYPEYRRPEWNYPMGYLTGDVRHRARMWASYDLPTPVGDFNISLLQNFNSGTRSSVDASIDSRPYVSGLGYLTPPATVTYFFGGRGSVKSDDILRTDLAVNYKVKTFGNVQLFVQPEVINLFNARGLESSNEEVLTAVDCAPRAPGGPELQSPCPKDGLQRFNPFTETPVKDVHYMLGPDFGEADSEGDYQQARTFRLSLGIRF